VEMSCECGSETSGSIIFWNILNGCTTRGFSSSDQHHGVKLWYVEGRASAGGDLKYHP
jgi:hypothetical protein